MDCSRQTWRIAALLMLAFALRLATVVLLSGEHQRPVTFEHGEIAGNLLNGRGFSVVFLGTDGATSQQAPLYPALLALLYAIFGVDSYSAIIAMQILQCVAGTALVWVVMQLGWQLVPARRSIGWCAGLLAAIYPTHLYMVTHVQVASWAAVLLAILCLAVLAPRMHQRPRQAVVLGILAGFLLLVEPILCLALPVLALWDYQRERQLLNADRWFVGSGLIRASLFTALTLLVIAPWLVRNYYVHGEFVFIKSTFGYAFWQGNNAASWGTDKIPKPTAAELLHQHDGGWANADRAQWAARHETLYIDDVLLKPQGYREFVGLTEPARARLLGRRATQFVQEQPQRYAALCLQRLRFFLLFDETNPKTAHPLYRVSTVAWLVLTFVGLLLARRHGVRCWPILTIVFAVTVFHALTITSARFRIPLEPLTLVWTALPLALPLQHLSRLWRGVVQPAPPASTAQHALRGPHLPRRFRSTEANVAPVEPVSR